MSEREGQSWAYTFRGVIGRDGALQVDTPAGPVYISRAVLPAGQGERLPDPEPDWQVGDVAMSSDGGSPTSRRIYERVKARDGGAAWWCNGAYLYDHEVPRPLVRLVPEGQS